MIKQFAEQIDPIRLKAHVQRVCGERRHASSPGRLQDTMQYLEEGFRESGFAVSRDCFEHAGERGINIIADKRGSSRPDEVLLITAHFDTVPGSPGADDNGSGLAGILECARVLGPLTMKRSLRIIAWDMEEVQPDGIALCGSRAYVKKLHDARENVMGVINFEMIGCTNHEKNSQTLPAGFGSLFPDLAGELHRNEYRGDFLGVVYDKNSARLHQAFAQAALDVAPELKIFSVEAPPVQGALPDIMRSDHAPFWAAGLPALMLTDTGNFRNPHYHAATDLPDTLDFRFMTRTVRATATAALRLLDA